LLMQCAFELGEVRRPIWPRRSSHTEEHEFSIRQCRSGAVSESQSSSGQRVLQNLRESRLEEGRLTVVELACAHRVAIQTAHRVAEERQTSRSDGADVSGADDRDLKARPLLPNSGLPVDRRRTVDPVAEPGDGLQHAVTHLNPRFPTQFSAREGDVGPSLRRIVLGARSELHRRVGPGEVTDEIRQLENRHFLWVADVHRARQVGEEEPQCPVDQVVDVAQRSRLQTVALNCEGFALQRLVDEVRDHPTVIGAHPRSVCVEDPHDRCVDAELGSVRRGEGLGEALGLVVARTGSDRIDIAPIGFRLRVDKRVAVRLGCRRQQEPGTLLLRQVEGVQRA
jgi:hypothetical protein